MVLAPKSRLVARCHIAIMIVLAGCADAPQSIDLVWVGDNGTREADLGGSQEGSDMSGFASVDPEHSGVTFANGVSDDLVAENRNVLNGSGVALGDFDADGLTDIYFGKLDGPNVLYRNRGDWEFEDVTDKAEVALLGELTTGVAFSDLDGDRDLDLLVTTLGSPNRLLLNDGDGTFTDASERLGSRTQRGSTSMAIGDVDADGDLDVYVANYKRIQLADSLPPESLAWEKVVEPEGQSYRIAERFEDHYELRIRGTNVVRLEKGEPDELLINDGTGSFTSRDIGGDGFFRSDGDPFAEPPTDWGLAVRFHDFNRDGNPDIYVCNDFESPDRMWLGRGDGTFQEARPESISKTSNSTMSIAIGDVNRDGHDDFFLADMRSPDYLRRQMQTPTGIPLPMEPGETGRPQVMQNTIFLGRGDETWSEVSGFMGVTSSDWTWSSTFLDVDLDGWEDLVATNGHPYDVQNADAQVEERDLKSRLRDFDEIKRVLLLFPSLPTPNTAFKFNAEEGMFEAQENGWGLGDHPDIAQGMAVGDLDNDGDLDVVMNRMNETAGIFRNTAGADRIAIRLVGAGQNTQGIGARVTLENGPFMQSREITAGGDYLSSGDGQLTFAVDPGENRLIVDWPSGMRSEIEAVANRMYEVHESEAREHSATPARPEFAFSEGEIAGQHQENVFSDFGRQPLLPRRLSQPGPGMAVGDLDDDGDEDLVVTGGAGTGFQVLTNAGGTLNPTTTGPPGASDETGVAILKQAGKTLILVTRSNYEDTTGQPTTIGVFEYRNGRVFEQAQLDAGPGTGGSLALGDVDGDGDLDLFSSGGFLPGRYPLSAPSRVFLNGDDGFTHSAEWSASLATSGIVSGAVMGDLDEDGDQDLILAEEWGPVRIMQNTGSGFVDATADFGMERFTGFWNGVVLVDENEDGHLDILATDWGTRSSGPGAFAVREVLHGYADENDTYDFLELVDVPGLGDGFTLRFEELKAAIPALRRSFRFNRDFATKSADEVLANVRSRLERSSGTRFGSSIFRNTDSGFVRQELPVEARFGPAWNASITDINGDGEEDVFLTQNFFAVRTQDAREDAGRGIWLIGGDALTADIHSGVAVYGDQRGSATADFNADRRPDVVVGQNAAPLKLYMGKSRPSVAVRVNGGPDNPTGVGAVVRLVYNDDTKGPARLITAGSGYLSQNSSIQLLGMPAGRTARAVVVRWPDGTESEQPVTSTNIEVRR